MGVITRPHMLSGHDATVLHMPERALALLQSTLRPAL